MIVRPCSLETERMNTKIEMDDFLILSTHCTVINVTERIHKYEVIGINISIYKYEA